MNREEFAALDREYTEFAHALREKDRDERGGYMRDRYAGVINPQDNYLVCNWRVMDITTMGAYAARHLTERKARTRIQKLRELAELCGKLADAIEERQATESRIRRTNKVGSTKSKGSGSQRSSDRLGGTSRRDGRAV